MPKHQAANPRDDIAHHIAGGVLLMACLFGGVGGWAATASISGAIIAQGSVAVDTNSKSVQHPEGGVVGAILVRDGDSVKAGDVLLRLDDTVLRAGLMGVDHQLVAQQARRARLDAEQAGLSDVASPPVFEGREAEHQVAAALAGERSLLAARRRGRDGETAQLKERIAQRGDEQRGLSAQLAAKAGELALIAPELAKLEEMLAKGLVTANRVLALQRDRARLEGEHGRLIADLARVKSQVSETELQILQIERDARTEIAKDLREAESRIAELAEKKVAAEDRLRRVDIRAPRAGIVAGSVVHTIGGVISPAETLMTIVPREDTLTLDTRVAPTDIDQLYPGQTAIVRLIGLSQRTTPELNASVERIAAEAAEDKRTGAPYYSVRVTLPAGELARLGDEVKLAPGMPAEAFMKTRTRTALSYLLRPLTDQLARALRDD
jgi:HlyD family secretion protein